MLKKNKSLASAQSSLGSLLASIPLSANGWTLLSVLVALVGFYFLAFEKRIDYAFVLFVFSFALDAIDGAVARAKNEVTKLGGFIDGVSDRLVEFLLAFGFLFFGIPGYYISGAAWLFLFIFFGACMTAFVKAYAGHSEAIPNDEAKKMPGIFERAERVLLLLAGMAGAILTNNIYYVTYAFVLASALSFVTVVQRLCIVFSSSRKNDARAKK